MKAPPPKGFQVLTAPIKIPDVLPDIDLSKKVTRRRGLHGKGRRGWYRQGYRRWNAAAGQRQPDLLRVPGREAGVAVPGQPAPRYPDMLRSANVEGEVLAQFVVDTTGRADMSTFKVLKSTHDLFTNAVKARSRT